MLVQEYSQKKLKKNIDNVMVWNAHRIITSQRASNAEC